MKTEQQIRDLLVQLYQELGEDPARLQAIRPVNGDWSAASSYEITRSDNAVALVLRKDIDEANEPNIAEALSKFAPR